MISLKADTKTNLISVTFSVDEPATVAVIGDFNDWDPTHTPLVKRSNGRKSATVKLAEGSEVRFRYLNDDGSCVNEDASDWFEPNGFGETNSVIVARRK